MLIKTLAGINPITVMEAFNLGFSDYSIPVQYAAEQWNFKIQSENVQWDLSVGAFDDNQLVGFILHGSKIRDGKQCIYNGGTAVIPSYRGKHLTRKMYDYILPVLRSKNIDKAQLEVIDTNQPAIKTYKAIGFENTRRLPCFKGNYQPKVTNNSYDIKPLNIFDWDTLKSFWDIEPTWQNDIEAVMLTPKTSKSLGIYHEENLVGYLVYNPTSNKILQLAIAKSYRQKGMANALLHYAFHNTDKPLLITNIEDTAANIIAFVQQLGMENIITQYEMELKL